MINAKYETLGDMYDKQKAKVRLERDLQMFRYKRGMSNNKYITEQLRAIASIMLEVAATLDSHHAPLISDHEIECDVNYSTKGIKSLDVCVKLLLERG